MTTKAIMRGGLVVAAWLVFLFSTGCSTHSQRVRAARRYFHNGNLPAANKELSNHVDTHPKDADATSLDLAMVQLLNGHPAEAETILRRVRDNLDHYEQKDALESGVSMLTDDQRLAYSGSDYEKVLVRVFLAVSNLLHDGQDVEAYSLQVNAKQQELLQSARIERTDESRPAEGSLPAELHQREVGVRQARFGLDASSGNRHDTAYAPLAIGPYLRGILREATFSHYDDAAGAYRQVINWNPEFHSAHIDLARAEQGVHSRPGHGVLYAFMLVNRGPVKEQVSEVPTSAALLVADRIVSAVGNYDVPPTLAPIKIPKVVIPPREVDHIRILGNGRPSGRTETICDVARLALRQEAVELPRIMGRAVARRVLKKSAIYAAKDYLETDSPLPDLALSAVGVAWEASEAADTRCWGLLPREIQTVRLELPAGQHALELSPVLANGTTVKGPRTTVTIEDGRNTYLLACFPGPRSVGRVIQR